MFKDVVAKIDTQSLSLGVEVAGDDGGVERPVMHRQREVVADHGNLVGASRFGDQRCGAAAIGTLQIFENHQSNFRAFRRPQCWIDVLGGSQ